MIDLLRNMNANLELEMVWVFVSPKNAIVLRLNTVCEGILCGSVWLYWGCLVLFIVVWSFTSLMFIDTCHYCNFAFIDIVHSVVNFRLWFYHTIWCTRPSIITLRLECKLWVVKSMSVLLVKHLLFFRDFGKLKGVVNFDCDFTLLLGVPDHPLSLWDLNLNYELLN